MPQPKKAGRFGGDPAHHNMMMANLATELFRHGRIRTTLAKAKTAQPLADRMVTFAKRGDLHSRRRVLRVIRDADVVHKLFADVGPAFEERDGGYTRVVKLGPRKGDAAPMALLELVEGVSVAGLGELEEAPRRRWSLRRRRGGTLSATARERGEAEAAAADQGQELSEATSAETEVADEAGREDDGVQADPAEVEARLAAEEEPSPEGPAVDASEPADDEPR